MDTRHQENYLKKYDEKSLEKLQSKTVFADPAYLFIFKKTEKIIAALYLITNLISDIEPIKWRVRKVSIGLMSDTLALKKSQSSQTSQMKQSVADLTITVSEIISLLKIASISNHISSMNYSIIQTELVLLMDSLQGLHGETIGSGALMLPQDFFNVPANYPVPQIFPNSNNFSKGQYRTSIGQKDNQTQQAQRDNLKDIKNSRHDKILQLLKDGKPIGIKDFAKEIKGCSEKTLQRELLTMVGSGVLKKIGERRWSLYSLA